MKKTKNTLWLGAPALWLGAPAGVPSDPALVVANYQGGAETDENASKIVENR